MQSILITEKDAIILEHDSELTNDELHEILECETITIITRKIGAHALQIVCDDNGLLKPNFMSACANEGPREVLVGNILITAYDNYGDERGLTDEEALEVQNHIYRMAQSKQRIGAYILGYSWTFLKP